MPLVRSRGVRVLLGLVALSVVGGTLGTGVLYWSLVRDLPDFRSLADYQPALVSRVLDRHGRPIGEFFERRRRLVGMNEIPQHVVMAFVAAEDDSFFEHSGLDYKAILRAAWVDILAGEKRQGASTITMQTAKNLLLTPERAFRRKLKEMILARRIEERFTKQEILFLYLNEIYFGSGAYGVAEAAHTYFDKSVGAVSLSEAALLAGLPKAPSKNSPFANPEAAEERRRYVLARMRESRFIGPKAYAEALAEHPRVARPDEYDSFEVADYFTEEVRRVLFDSLGGEAVLRQGLTIHTTLDLDLQRAAVKAVRRGLEALDQRRGYRGHLRRVEAEQVPEEILRLAAENDLVGVEASASGRVDTPPVGTAPPLFPLRERPPPRPVDAKTPLVGVVTDVDVEVQTAWVAFAPGVSAGVHLADVAWARKPDPKKRAKPIKSIELIFSVGDVTRFIRVPEDAKPIEGVDPEEPRVTLHQEPRVEGALVALDVETGDVLALVGGYDFARSEFDRALQARRQPGSAFKPLIYATAVANGMTGASIIHDRPVVYTDEESGFTWRPENYGHRFLGPLTLREALARSVNNATIHLLRQVGVQRVIDFAHALGIESPLERNLSLALGASPVSLLELTRAYAVFPAGGRLVVPTFIRRVEDSQGELLMGPVALVESDRAAAAEKAAHEVDVEEIDDRFAPADPLAIREADDDPPLDEIQAYLGLELLRAVVMEPRGTGRRARSLGRPLGGKTGTTNDQGDAWFVGFSPDIAVGAWVGYDEKRVLGRGETGGRAALPVWMDFMRAAHANRPVRDFPIPAGIVVVRIDRRTGLLADSSSQDSFFQAFAEGTEPTETASSELENVESRRRLRMEF